MSEEEPIIVIKGEVVGTEEEKEEVVVVKNSGGKELHPCQYCGNLCFGKQCKQCHLKMIESQKGICLDCHNTFNAIRRDGSKRRRCLECQTAYNNKYISECPDCHNTYHAYMEDGRVFEKCFDCYKKTLHKCNNCDSFTKFEYALCRNCYQSSSHTRRYHHQSHRELDLNSSSQPVPQPQQDEY